MNQTPQNQNDINTLPSLESFRYENVFNVYQNDNTDYFYNILAKTNFPDNIESSYYKTYTIPANNMPYTLISYNLYGTILLWWLICSVNKIQNPVFTLPAGTQIKYLTPTYVRLILAQLNAPAT
jgi:hypothetical protein